ncbi:MAG: hypothetical protein M1812_000283 [Candelaria pacifica]|nr:MAG: hypothetical protein M1812_000283 [Candelaria pacifica]
MSLTKNPSSNLLSPSQVVTNADSQELSVPFDGVDKESKLDEVSQEYSLSGHQDELALFQLPTPASTAIEASQRPIATEALNEAPFEQLVERDSDWVISGIESVFEDFADCILSETGTLSISMRIRTAAKGQRLDPASGAIRTTTAFQTRLVGFPGKDSQETWRFTVLVRILGLIHEALVSQTITSKRDIYYKDPTLFLKQGVVDQCVDDIACTFGVQRSCLNVVAAAKGLVVGSMTIQREDGSVIELASEKEGQLVPNVKNISNVDISCLRWILVVEKEATFCSLAASNYWRTSKAGKGLLLTAKGYPDILTRAFLRLLSEQTSAVGLPKPSIYALVDFDPDGLGILSTYKYGSKKMAHENAQLNVPSIRWIGVRSSDLNSESKTSEEQQLLKLTARDRKKAAKMLETKIIAEEGLEAEWRGELQVMLMLNVKAETQILSEREGGLETWLDDKLRERESTGSS